MVVWGDPCAVLWLGSHSCWGEMPSWVSGAEEDTWMLESPSDQQNGHSSHLFWAGEARSAPTWPSLCSFKWVCDFLWPLWKAAQYGGDRPPTWVLLLALGHGQITSRLCA